MSAEPHEHDPTDRVAAVGHEAAVQAGIDDDGARPLRYGSNALFLLPRAELVARVGRPGSFVVAQREVRIAGWLADQGLRSNMPAPGIEQPVRVGDRSVTWWLPLAPHRHATTTELATVLRRLHELPVPAGLGLSAVEPLARVEQRLGGATGIAQRDRAWLLDRLACLREKITAGVVPTRTVVVHGSAWQGNVVVPDGDGPVLLDFETMALGHPDWDLIPVAVDHADFARLSDADYDALVGAYGGHDVTHMPWFRTMADIQELRWTAFVAEKAAGDSRAAAEAAHRIACLRGEVPKPWTWTAF
ncbi:aminoglycoside phosphotransferase family protein [Myceligenerans halotolerans]